MTANKARETHKDVEHHPNKSLILRPVSEGARMWSVALQRTLFTYFEVDPECRFEMHSHASEQITMVLQGELFFEVKDRIICVKKGEVIAIPSDIPHAAFTKDRPVIAVDAWSPIAEEYSDRNKHKWSLENERIIASCIGMKM